MDGSLQHNLSQDNKRKPNVGKFLAGNACILIATIFWGVNVSVTKALIPEWMTSEGVSAVRLIGGCVLFWIASSFVHCDKINRQDWKKLIPTSAKSTASPRKINRIPLKCRYMYGTPPVEFRDIHEKNRLRLSENNNNDVEGEG